jgi:hypothetical protein
MNNLTKGLLGSQVPRGAFFVGNELDPLERSPKRSLRLDVSDLSIHGVIIGMTGSGKTGLGITLMEEALINSIPVISIDVKGDLSNLGRDTGVVDITHGTTNQSTDGVEGHRQELIRLGLADRLRKFQESTEISLFTPGNTNGKPVSLVNSLKPPARQLDDEKLEEIASNISSSLLGLVGLKPEPFKSREHLLLSEVLVHAWRNGTRLSFGEVMRMVSYPPFENIGGVDVEAFMPLQRRKELAFSMNGIIGSPNFKRWTQGDPLDIDFFLQSESGKVPAVMFYLAHLDGNEKMMFVSLLLQEIYSWMLTKGGASRPRLLLLFDEVYGFLPPFPRNPPSKSPLLSIIKQGRSFGVTALLSTQNPVDIDYKALGNVYMWIIGRLQTKNDRARVLEGLNEANIPAVSGKAHDLGRLISSLRQREFLMCQTGEKPPRLFRSRQCLSNLLGPLTLEQVVGLSGEREKKHLVTRVGISSDLLELPPLIFEGMQQGYMPSKHKISDIIELARAKGLEASREDVSLFYEPFLLLEGRVIVHRTRPYVHIQRQFAEIAETSSSAGRIRFSETAKLGLDAKMLSESQLEARMAAGFRFKPTNDLVRNVASYRKTLAAFARHMSGSSTTVFYRCEQTEDHSRVGESRTDFEQREKETIQRKREEELNAKHEKEISRILLKLEEEIDKVGRFRPRLQGARTSMWLRGIAEPLIRGRLRSLPSKVQTEYGRLREIERKIEVGERRIERLNSEKEEAEHRYREQMQSVHASSMPSVTEVIVEPSAKEVEVRNVTLVWVPVAEVQGSNRDRRTRIEINCFNLAVSRP